MSRHYALLASFLFVSASPLANSQQSLQSLHARVPAPPTSAAAAPAWLKSPDLATLRQQLKDQRAFVDRLHKDAAAKSMASASTGGIDFARAQRDPAYAQEVQQKLASMRQEEQMKEDAVPGHGSRGSARESL